ATVLLTVIPGLEGTLTNRATTAANEADLDPSNNVAVATVTVLVPPQITSQPQGLAVTNGAAATFSVGALGTNLRYQWRKDGTALTGATNAVLTITNVQPANEGAYTVVLTNEVGSVTSSPAALSVLLPVAITVPPQN